PDPNDLTFIHDVLLVTTAASDSQVALTVNGHSQSPELVHAGQARFANVVLPPGEVILVASVTDNLGNPALAEVHGKVTTNPPPCDIVGFYPGLVKLMTIATPVLNVSVDQDASDP